MSLSTCRRASLAILLVVGVECVGSAAEGSAPSAGKQPIKGGGLPPKSLVTFAPGVDLSRYGRVNGPALSLGKLAGQTALSLKAGPRHARLRVTLEEA